ncbi:MAG: enoyl-CoA hydratase-related protein [Roseovarius sp.]|uniref:enoyl-CoA hydratase-related protein n=1 Tax=Roseovarius sp. TaxID=1486281 RepID=UPI0032EF3953
MTVHTRREGTTGYVELDTPPVNAIGPGIRKGLLDAVAWAEAEGLDRVILSGRGRMFSAGADIRNFGAPLPEPYLPDVLNRIERSPVPWIAAAHGAALGGGLELMLACRYRIAAPDTRLGLPEVSIGVISGAGGTQRLPRLVGLEKALELVPTGRAVTAEEARAIGLIDEVDADPVAFAELTNAEWLGMKVPVSELNSGELPSEVFEAARRAAEADMPGQIAPQRAIDLIEVSQHMPFDDGLIQERAAFLDLGHSAQSKALNHVFFAERAARAPERFENTPRPGLDRVAVLGAGAFGSAVAFALLMAGVPVTLVKTGDEPPCSAATGIDRQFDLALRQGRLSEETAAARRAALTLAGDMAGAGPVPLAIDTAEGGGDRAGLLSALPPGAVFATTALHEIDRLARRAPDPGRVVGVHLCAPDQPPGLLEIVPGMATSGPARATAFDLAGTLGLIPVLSQLPGHAIGRRLLSRYAEAAETVLMDGSTPWEVDEAMVTFGFAMGPFEAQDISGLDLAHAERRLQDATRDPNRRYIPVADRMVDLGKLGRKTGAGWYRYPGGGGKVDDPIVADLALEEARYAKVERCDYTAEEIRHRLLLALINEAADILYEGVAASATDVDLITVFGQGFPRWRGGVMHYADTLGPAKVLDGLRTLAAEDPLVWKPSPLIKDCAVRGLSFADWRR